jgi:hypothetical protein
LDVVEFLIIDLDGEFCVRSQADDEELLTFQANPHCVRVGGHGYGCFADADGRDGCAFANCLYAAVAEQLQSTIEVADPRRILFPTGTREDVAGRRIVKDHRQRLIGETWLIRIRPEEFVGCS